MAEEKEKVIEGSEEAKEIKVEDKKASEKETKKKKKKQKPEDVIAEVQEELQELKDKYFRSLAETENFKKRMTEDLKRERKYAGYSLASKLMDSLEIFNQAVNMETEDPQLKNFLYGFKMIDDMILNALKEEGLSVIETKVGDEFDPTKQHAMDKEYNPEQKENTILKVVKKGYMFKDRLLKPTQVVINIKPEDKKEEKEMIIEETNEEGKVN